MYLSLKNGKVIKIFKFMVKNWQSFHCLSSDIRIAKVRDNIVLLGAKNLWEMLKILLILNKN